MDALMAAIVAGALAQIGDRPAWLAAILADRYRAPGIVILAAALAGNDSVDEALRKAQAATERVITRMGVAR